MEKALLLWSRVISHTGSFQNIISDRDPKVTSALWTNLHRLFGTRLSFSKENHPQKKLADKIIQTVEGMIKRFCAYGLEFKDSDGFTHDWCTLIPTLELAYKTSVHSSTGQTANWDKIHKVPDFKVGDLVLVSTLNYNNIKGPKKLEYSYVGTFFIVSLHRTNPVQVGLSGELEYKTPILPVSLIKPYQPADKKFFPLRNPTPLTVPPVEQSEDIKIKKFIKESRIRGKNQGEYLVRYRIQYMKMNGWQNREYLTQINSQEDLDMKEGQKPEYVYKCALNYLN
ncbi:hypothetical protein O181_010890 [Austropuccinia psidii MF-1]|uniref:Integrase catalytic domain-containing protein n=1 Tax=Austropuccinia psidii MF-1 TaxID=1389203 RepID=A0A9Q3GLD3_9BASI|nr:hypothetical protein [Austropuccinia psidii MF-1]